MLSLRNFRNFRARIRKNTIIFSFFFFFYKYRICCSLENRKYKRLNFFLFLNVQFHCYLFLSYLFISKRSYPSVNGEKWSEGDWKNPYFHLYVVPQFCQKSTNTLSYLVPFLTILKVETIKLTSFSLSTCTGNNVRETKFIFIFRILPNKGLDCI